MDDTKQTFWIVLTAFWPDNAPYPIEDWYVQDCSAGAQPETCDQGEYWEQVFMGPSATRQEAIDTMIAWLDDDPNCEGSS